MPSSQSRVGRAVQVKGVGRAAWATPATPHWRRLGTFGSLSSGKMPSLLGGELVLGCTPWHNPCSGCGCYKCPKPREQAAWERVACQTASIQRCLIRNS